MGDRTVFERSPLGSRVRSPLGAFRGRVEQFLEILTAPIFVLDGETYTVTGELFLASQGAGSLQIANTPAFDDVVVTQSIVTWADDEIVFTFDAMGLPGEGLLWIRVTNDDDQFDDATTQAGAIVDNIQLVSADISLVGGSTAFCGLSANGRYCYARLNSYEDQLFELGYDIDGAGWFGASEFFKSALGFYLVGADSEKVLDFGPPDHVYEVSSGDDFNGLTWCSVDGLAVFYGILSGGGSGIIIPYEQLSGVDTCATTHGWTDDEDVYLIPKHPVTIQITEPTVAQTIGFGTDVDLAGFAYAQEGEISDSIEWYTALAIGAEPGEFISTGATAVAEDIEEDTAFVAKITNAHGRVRYAWTSVSVLFPTIASVFPSIANTAGGQRLTLVGTEFYDGVVVEVGGNPATSVTVLSPTLLQCIAPAGSGAVDVSILDFDLSGVFEYTAAANISITDIAPNTGTSAGGTSVTITGTGFTADCVVLFGDIEVDFEPATNVVFVNSTEITCDSPAGSGVVDVAVFDTATAAGDVEIDGFTYT